MFEKGQETELEIVDISDQGKGVGRVGGKAGGMAVFVDRTVPGDVVKARLTKVKKHYAFANLMKILDPSEHRVTPLCHYADICGGCMYAHLDYDGQLELKETQVRSKLERLGGIKSPLIRPIEGMPEPFHYRNKAAFPISTGGVITKKGGAVESLGKPSIGFYRGKTHDVTNCKKCLLQSAAAMACADAVRRYMKEDHITAWDGKWQKGLMRRLVVRTGFMTGEVMVILVINGRHIPAQEKLVGMLDEALKGVGYTLESVYLNENREKGEQIFGKEMFNIAGSKTIREKIGGLTFEISPLSFYQVNPVMTRVLYDKVLEYADFKGDENVLDIYCGVGTIGLWCAGKAGYIVGIESVREAVIDANRNAVINGIVDARFICGNAEEVLPEMIGETLDIEEAKKKYDEVPVSVAGNADIAILDPPRAGCRPELLEAVTKVGPKKIIYVSCDPATLARDVRILCENGYQFIEASPVDMFPHTRHVETVVLMSRVDK